MTTVDRLLTDTVQLNNRSMMSASPDRRPRSVPLEGDARDRILQAALRAFAERGFDGTSTREIAAEAGVAQGLLSYHFANKLTLWEAAVDWAFALLYEEFRGATRAYQDLDPETRIRAAMKRFVRFVSRHPEVHRLMMHEGAHDGPRLRWIVEKHLRRFFAQAQSFFSDALPLIDMSQFYYALIGAMSHAFAVAPEFKLVTGRDALAPEFVETHASTVVDWLIDGALVQQAALERRAELVSNAGDR